MYKYYAYINNLYYTMKNKIRRGGVSIEIGKTRVKFLSLCPFTPCLEITKNGGRYILFVWYPFKNRNPYALHG